MWKLLLAIPLVAGAAYVTYTEGQKMWWLFGPIGAGYVFWLTRGPERRRHEQAELWREMAGGPRRVGDATKQTAKRKKPSRSPAELLPLVEQAGGGLDVGTYELHPGLAYVTFRAADSATLSDFTAVLMQLEEPAPRFTVRPLPIIEGKRVPNVGILFKKDRAFTTAYLVEGADASKIRRFLSPDIREALCEMPDLWLRVEGRGACLGVYGSPGADKVAHLVDVADALFAEHGAGGGPALVSDDEPPRSKPKPKKKSATAVPSASQKQKGKPAKQAPPPAH